MTFFVDCDNNVKYQPGGTNFDPYQGFEFKQIITNPTTINI